MSENGRRVAAPRDIQLKKPIGTELVSWAGETMGTSWSARAVAPSGFDARGVQTVMKASLDAIIAQMSTWEPNADISRFNDLPAGASLPLAERFRTVLDCALDVARETGGAFDPTLGALVDLWGFGPTQHPQAPSDSDIAHALDQAGWQKLSMTGTSLHQPGGVRLDLSGIAKGYAVDELARALEAQGLNSYLVEIGGELRGAGVKPDAQPWWVEIEEPRDSARPPLVVALHDLSIATSGDYRRFRDLDGKNIAHTIDPRSGRSLENGAASVTVLHSNCMRADAYATALTVMGAEPGLEFANAQGLAARIITRDDLGAHEHLSRAFADMLD